MLTTSTSVDTPRPVAGRLARENSIHRTLARQNPIVWVLLIAGLARLVNIGAPIIGVHSWRQADTAAMARNFFENGFRLFWPQVDWGGAGPGFVESEFPIMPFLVALLYRVMGVHEWLGRGVAAACSLVAGYALYHLVKGTSGERVALWVSAFYLFLPLSLFYSRAFMPDSMMMAASILTIAWFFDWTETGRLRYLIGSATSLSLACLLKLPCLYLGLPLFYMAWRRFGVTLWRQPVLWAYAVLVLVLVAAWYGHAHRILLGGGLTFGIWEYGTDKWGNWDLVASGRFWTGLIFRQVAERWLTWAGFAIAISGFVLTKRNTKERLFDFWLGAVTVYFVIVAKGNFVHEYYQWPLLPAASFYIAKALDGGLFIRQREFRLIAVGLTLLATCALSAVRYSSYLRKEDAKASAVYGLAREVRRVTEPGALILVVDRGNPTILYLSHRKGWHAVPNEVDGSFLGERAREGAKYVVAMVANGDPELEALRERLRSRFHRVVDNGEFLIYALAGTRS